MEQTLVHDSEFETRPKSSKGLRFSAEIDKKNEIQEAANHQAILCCDVLADIFGNLVLETLRPDLHAFVRHGKHLDDLLLVCGDAVSVIFGLNRIPLNENLVRVDTAVLPTTETISFAIGRQKSGWCRDVLQISSDDPVHAHTDRLKQIVLPTNGKPCAPDLRRNRILTSTRHTRPRTARDYSRQAPC